MKSAAQKNYEAFRDSPGMMHDPAAFSWESLPAKVQAGLEAGARAVTEHIAGVPLELPPSFDVKITPKHSTCADCSCDIPYDDDLCEACSRKYADVDPRAL